MSRQCLAHFFVCVLYDGLARFFCYVSVLRTVLNVSRWIVCHGSTWGTVLYVFCQLFGTFECHPMFFMCCVAFLSL